MSHTAAAALRAVTFRVSSTPTKQLPHLTPWIVNTLVESKSLLASAAAGKAKDSAHGVLVHKLKTQISTLLNDKSPEGRWVAVVLIKTTVDLGGWEVLQGSGPWVRGLLGILGKQDHSAAKKLCIITLARIFLCTHEYPTLIREITTPSLPAFLTACLNLIHPKSAPGKAQPESPRASLLPVVLGSFCRLLPNHPTIFRSFETRLTEILLPLLAPAESFDKLHPVTASTPPSSPQITDAAQQLYILLHYCAPKSASSEDWSKRMLATINQFQATSDVVFRAVIEDYESLARSTPQARGNVDYAAQAKENDSTALAMPTWYGIRAGSARLVGILGLIKSFITTQTAAPITFPITEVIDLAMRALSVAGPMSQGTQDETMITFNKQIGKDEREELWGELPSIHQAAIEILGALFDRFENASTAVVPIALDQITWIFKREAHSIPVRLAAYATMAKMVLSSASGFTRSQVADLSRMVRSACEDVIQENLLAAEEAPVLTTPAKNGQKKTGSLNADTFLRTQAPAPATQRHGHEPIYYAAVSFLTAFLARTPAQHIGQSVRAVVDRTAVLSGNSDLMLASVLNPPYSTSHGKSRSSILPLLARAAPDDLAVECLLRPRMPAIKINYLDAGEDDTRNDEDDNEEMDEDSSERHEDTQEDFDEPAAPHAADLPSQNTPAMTADQLPPSNRTEVRAIMDSLKRDVSKIDSTSPEAKRSRTELENHPHSSSTVDSASRQLLEETALPVPVLIEESSGRAEGSHIAVVDASEVDVQAAESDDDGSDIEIPEIDIEPDTEDEEDDEAA